MELLCGIRILAVNYFVLSQSTRLTERDGQTERPHHAYAFAVTR